MRHLIIILTTVVLMSSCGQRLIYFQEQKESKNTLEKIELAKKPDPRAHLITSGDILNVQMNTFNKEVMQQFNLGRIETEGQLGPSGIMVDEEGYIFLPIAGKLKVNGLTIAEAENILKDTLSSSLTDFSLSLKLSGFRVVVLGAVKMPGIKILSGDQATIVDAISLSGDLTEYGHPDDIKIVRQSSSGKKTIIANLSDVDLFLSEGYYLQSNDIIYVEHTNRRFVIENLQFFQLFAIIANVTSLLLLRF